MRFDIAITSRSRVFVHAGVVVWNGRAIVVPAPSMHGKSRLVDALVRAGAVYYSDEYAVFDGHGLAHPFRKPLTLRQDEGPARRVVVPDCDDHRAPGVPVGAIVSTWFRPGEPWRPRRGTRGEGLMALLGNTVRARIAPGTVLQVLGRVVARAIVLEGPRGEADGVAPALLHACEEGA